MVARRPIRHFSPVKFLAANTILLMRKWNHACSLLVYVISVITPGRQRALTAFRRYYLLKNKLRDRMIKQLLNSVIAKYRDLSVASRSIICRSLWLRQIIDLPDTDKSPYFAQEPTTNPATGSITFSFPLPNTLKRSRCYSSWLNG